MGNITNAVVANTEAYLAEQMSHISSSGSNMDPPNISKSNMDKSNIDKSNKDKANMDKADQRGKKSDTLAAQKSEKNEKNEKKGSKKNAPKRLSAK